MTKDIAIIQFPGSNCEYETQSACEMVGLVADIVPWNMDFQQLTEYKGFILPGGFSFQDRVRAGAVSAKLPIMSFVKQQAESGVPVLGICNGCQVLAELGLIDLSGLSSVTDMALAPNMKQGQFNGFRCDWVYVKVKSPQKSVFTQLFDDGDVFPIPINHGEGNFKFKQGIGIDDHMCFTYCDSQGNERKDFPVNPNGSDFNIAGIANKRGNVLAMMPHPERAVDWYHVPHYMDNTFSYQRRQRTLKHGPWLPFFKSLAQTIKG